MIKLMSPPAVARRVLHMNCPSRSPGGKDYVLVKMFNGALWACNGPAHLVRNGRGSIQNPSKDWQEMVSEKTRKGYTVVGEYDNRVGAGGFGSWWSQTGETYADVINIPIQPLQPAQPVPAPTKTRPAVQRKQPEAKSLATQYPMSKKVKEMWGEVSGGNDWFLAIP